MYDNYANWCFLARSMGMLRYLDPCSVSIVFQLDVMLPNYSCNFSVKLRNRLLLRLIDTTCRSISISHQKSIYMMVGIQKTLATMEEYFQTLLHSQTVVNVSFGFPAPRLTLAFYHFIGFVWPLTVSSLHMILSDLALRIDCEYEPSRCHQACGNSLRNPALLYSVIAAVAIVKDILTSKPVGISCYRKPEWVRSFPVAHIQLSQI